MCAEHPNRMLANGPNHPGPGPEEIPMVDVSLSAPVCKKEKAKFKIQCLRSHDHMTICLIAVYIKERPGN